MIKDVLMKHSSAEKTALRQELRILSFFLLFISADFNFAQLPVNGFCKLNTFTVDAGVNSILTFNYNHDASPDLFLYNPRMKRASILEGYGSGEFRYERKVNLPSSISNIRPVYNSEKQIESYAFLSRTDRIFGLYAFSNTGQPSLKLSYKFDTYPDGVSSADINANGKNEHMIFGGSFDGISILSFFNGSIAEEKIIAGTSFSHAHFVDLNNDGFKDIVAYNLFSGMIHFMFNNGEGVFREVRKIPFYSSITQFKTFNANKDSYTDIIISSGNSIKIYFGDFRSAYDSTITITTQYPVDDFVISDFNADGFFDITYLSKDAGVIATIFGRANGNFHKEFFQLQREKIQSIALYSSKSVNGVVYATGRGEVGLISRLHSFDQDVELAAALDPGSINYFDNEKNGITDLVFIDQAINTINLLTRNKDGIPDKLFTTPLFGNHQLILVDDNRSQIKSFYCYSVGAKLIEIKTFNTLTDEVIREQIYVPGNLVDFKIVNPSSNNPLFFTVYIKDNKTFFGEFRKSGGVYQLNEIRLSNLNIVGAEIIPSSKPIVYFWTRENNQLKLTKADLSSGKAVTTNRQSIDEFKAEIVSVVNSSPKSGEYMLLSFIHAGDKNYTSVVNQKSEELISLSRQVSGFRIKSKNHLSFNEVNFVFFYDDEKKSIRKIELSSDLKRIRILDIFNNISLTDFIIKNLELSNRHLIYSEKEKKTISIKKLP
jgi:hypothetical protein